MLRMLIDHIPELKDWEVHWLLANLRFDAVYPGIGPGIALAVRIINDGFAASTTCDVVARVVEVERSDNPNTTMLIRYRHDERVRHLRALSPGETEEVDFGAFYDISGAPEMCACVVIDPATEAHPFGRVREITKQDNTFCEWYEVYEPIPQEDLPSKREPTIEDFHDGDPPPYRLYRRIVPDLAR
jgi:hypothetical protein